MCETLPCNLTYWPNDLQIIRGADKLEACALNAAWRSCRLIATCCSSSLLVNHPAYNGTVVMAYKEALVNATLPTPAFRADVRDLTEELVAALPRANCPVLSPPGSEQYDAADNEHADAAFDAATGLPPTSAYGLTSSRAYRLVFVLMCSLSALVPYAALGVTFDQIIEALTPEGAGPRVRILDVPLDVSLPCVSSAVACVVGDRGVGPARFATLRCAIVIILCRHRCPTVGLVDCATVMSVARWCVALHASGIGS